MELTNSKRLLYTASYVVTQFTPDEQSEVESKPGGGYPKANHMLLLDLNSEDLDRLQMVMNAGRTFKSKGELDALFNIAQRLTVTERPMSTMELAAEMAPISYDAINHFLELSATVKENAVPFSFWLDLSKQRQKISPIGRLHLERIEMYPAGVQKGELVFTVPMAPGETVTISHKEWSTSTREFEEIVQDYFESYSERGVAEKTDTAMSTENEAKHSSAINFGASLSGTYVGVTLTTTLGIANTNEERQSVKQSMQKNREVTEKASARTRKEHKVSMKLETKMGVEDHSSKTITNDAAVPIRIDYYRMMRKWRTDLFRYGLRQTYDIAIPLPGVRLWALHQKVAELDKKLREPFVFGLNAETLTEANWVVWATKFGASSAVVPPPPAPQQKKVLVPDPIGFFTADQAQIDRFGKIDFEIPAGYWLSSAKATAIYSAASGTPHFTWHNGGNHSIGADSTVIGNLSAFINPSAVVDPSVLVHPSGNLAATYSYNWIHTAGLTLELTFDRTPATEQAWKREAWSAIKASAEAKHHEELARVQEERDRLWRLLNGKDTLSLRRLEREELVRLVMKWLLGPGYPLISTVNVATTVGQILTNEDTFQISNKSPDGSPTFSFVREKGWYQALLFGEYVKFIHQAVEWENLLYFLYPYFWGSETIGKDKLLFEHIDPEHERFLRAGYARIVLTIRPGFEESFTHLMEKGTLQGISTQPYITIAQEIANFARTNYAGIPPANPELHARPLLYPEQRATWDIMQDVMKKVDDYKTMNGHYPVKLDDLPSGLPVDAWGNPFIYRLPGLGADYDLVSLGANNEEGGEGLDADISSAAGASLVATWFDYTPTSGLDIEIDTKAEDIA